MKVLTLLLLLLATGVAGHGGKRRMPPTTYDEALGNAAGLSNSSSYGYAPARRLLSRKEGKRTMRLDPPPSWWVLLKPNSNMLENIGAAPDLNASVTFDEADGDVQPVWTLRIAVGKIKGGTNSNGVLAFTDTSELTTWDCLAGWLAKPTADVSFSLNAPPSTKQVETSENAYVACETPAPKLVTSSSVKSSPSGSPFPSPSPSPSPVASISSPPVSSSSASSSNPVCPFPSPFPSPSPASAGLSSSLSSAPANHSASSPASPSNSPSPASPSPPSSSPSPSPASPLANSVSSATVSNSPPPFPSPSPSPTSVSTLNDTWSGKVWVEIPDPAVSVLPLDPQVGAWNAAGPFVHVFEFHAWVPTYLSEAFDIYTRGQEGSYTSVKQCTIGISTQPSGTEVATYTLTSAQPLVTPSGDVKGAYLHC